MGVPDLSKRKSRKKKNTSFTYEVYGILILILSVIALASGRGDASGMGPIGRALNYITLLLAGEWALAIPLIAIYVGLYAMIKRSWPNKWSYKKTGVLILLLVATGFTSLSGYHENYPDGNLGIGTILSDPVDNLKQYLQDPDGVITYDDYLKEVGGGLIGAAVFGLLYLFFDFTGSKFMLYALILIGLLYLTGWSYVNFFRRIKQLLVKAGGKMKREGRSVFALLRQKRQARRAAMSAVVPAGGEGEYGDDPEDVAPEFAHPDQIDEETYNPYPARRRKRSGSLFGFRRNKREAGPDTEEDGADFPAGDDWPREEELAGLPTDAGGEPDDATDIVFRHFEENRDDPATDADLSDEPAGGVGFDAADGFPEGRADPVLETDGEPAGMTEGQEQTAADPPEQTSAAPRKPKPYKLPPLHLLSRPVSSGRGSGMGGVQENARKLEQTLQSFGVRAKVSEVVRGPAVTRYEITPDIGVKVSRIVSLTDDIALALAAKDIRMEAPIPGKSAIGIEVPNEEVSVVTMREVMESAAFQESAARLAFVLGRDISGKPIVANLAAMPHLLVAGATGSGKSVCINTIITSVLFKARPEEVKFLMVDPKMVELNVYNGIPHLLAPVVTDPRRASLALKKIVQEMEKRYELFSKSGQRNIEGYNAAAKAHGMEPLPYIVVIVDELADLMMVAANDVEDAITRLAQMARAAGIHLIIATQRPSVDVITGVIKANIPSRIAFGVSSQVDSRTILDMAGAEKLLGRGDMLYLPVGATKPTRVQGAFLSDNEVEAVVNYVRAQGEAEYREELVPESEELDEAEDEFRDELFDQAALIVLEAKQASVSLLQRRLRIGYTRAARLIDSLEAAGIIGPYEGSKPRDVLMTVEQYQRSRTGS